MSASKRHPSERLIGQAAGETFICAWGAKNGWVSRFTRAGVAVYGSEGRGSDICKIASGDRIPEDPNAIERIRQVSPAAADLFYDLCPAISPESTRRERRRIYARVLQRLGATAIEVHRVRTQVVPFHPHGYDRMPRPDSVARLTANILELRLHRESLAWIRLHQCWWTAIALIHAAIEHPALIRVAPLLWEDLLERFGPTQSQIHAFGEPEDIHTRTVGRVVPDRATRDRNYQALRSSVSTVLCDRALPEWTHPCVSYWFVRALEAAQTSERSVLQTGR